MSVAISNRSKGINTLHPKTAAKLAKLMDLCRDKEIPLLVTCTLRTDEEQDALYNQGRNGNYGKIVTNARGYESPHAFGIAFDVCKNVKGEEYSDNTFFDIVGELGESIGLTWGGRFTKFVDKPHFEDRTFGTALELKQKYGNLEAFLKTWSGGQ